MLALPVIFSQVWRVLFVPTVDVVHARLIKMVRAARVGARLRSRLMFGYFVVLPAAHPTSCSAATATRSRTTCRPSRSSPSARTVESWRWRWSGSCRCSWSRSPGWDRQDRRAARRTAARLLPGRLPRRRAAGRRPGHGVLRDAAAGDPVRVVDLDVGAARPPARRLAVARRGQARCAAKAVHALLAAALLCVPATGTAGQRVTVEAPSVRSTTAVVRLAARRRLLARGRRAVARAVRPQRALGPPPRGRRTTPIGSFANRNDGLRQRRRARASATATGGSPAATGGTRTRPRRPTTPPPVACGTSPAFAAGSEPLWRSPRAYVHFAVVEDNAEPAVPGLGSAIFIHADMGVPTSGCVVASGRSVSCVWSAGTCRIRPRWSVRGMAELTGS